LLVNIGGSKIRRQFDRKSEGSYQLISTPGENFENFGRPLSKKSLIFSAAGEIFDNFGRP